VLAAVALTAGVVAAPDAAAVVGVVAGLVVTVGLTVVGVAVVGFVVAGVFSAGDDDPHAASSNVVTPARLYFVMVFTLSSFIDASLVWRWHVVEESIVGRKR